MWLLVLLACSGSPPADPAPEPARKPGVITRIRQPQAANGARNDTGEDEPDAGLWNKAREPVSLEDEIKALEAIGYVGGDQEATGKVGVTVHDPRAQPGLNFWVSGHRPEATLMDMDGKVLHTWHRSYEQAFPGGEKYSNKHGSEFWRRAWLLPTGEILAIFEGHGLVKLDRNSNVVWRWDGRAHHDLEVLPDGRIWVLARKGDLIPRVNASQPVLEDFAVLLSPDGEVLQEISLLEALDQSDGKHILYDKRRRRGDIFHTNSLQVLQGRAEQRDPAFKAGNLLLSMRTLSAIMVLDPEKKAIVWWHQGEYKHQHDPKILANGHLMLFDNIGYRQRSAVREFDVKGMRQLWAYTHTPQHPFFSRFTGSAERLENGNTLIAESGYGRVFEIAPGDEIVWEYHNPNRAGDQNQFVAIIPDLIRYPLDYAPWLDE
ncbi:MAG: arylsulfotransferase family protein [Myxococcota bacterium]